MTPLGNLTTACRRVPALALALTIALASASPASADDASAEHEQLAALARQLNLIDRLAEHAANSAPQERARYHFDYARLRADLKRVRAGLQDYLVPQRAQPRDPVPLAGDYVRHDRADDEAPSP
ncbi:TPA: RAQPRD family integrative conjugative element protein [Pseudomonas aeruginosa]|uniref:integrative conjugative element protein, RAQPRD family n=1 Tax=Pseudomonas aeruginosa TaxID=287 RepID=UPI001EEB597B|nr:RAQPRD family integrative conjugative element protein [Pseudomonas aeruginosa]HBN7625076.1 RAQPRD family integrative conjugative element protein [Pseudomonas aeruginosa]HBN7629528.1 RAQPRD family integrative conjugative element protein [Pseudomonas aeruginosa]HBN7645995.1 RAQPRD family integrative conjugative element protein [Pseudomonas aeruginosa]HBN7650264.1 RAQPRD family integrative conjugative element protein [Pseudomonas aeruginosa]HBN8841326.1 RAQPRD family integrative conjugative el